MTQLTTLSERQTAAQSELQESLLRIAKIRTSVVEKFFEAANPAADLIIENQKFSPSDELDLAAQKFRADNAKFIIKQCGIEQVPAPTVNNTQINQFNLDADFSREERLRYVQEVASV